MRDYYRARPEYAAKVKAQAKEWAAANPERRHEIAARSASTHREQTNTRAKRRRDLVIGYVAIPNSAKTHCSRGHALSGENLIVRPNGHRRCRSCRIFTGLRRRAETREAQRAKRRAWRLANPAKHVASQVASQRRRMVYKAGVVLTIKVKSDVCGVCQGPLSPTADRWDPLFTTVGHEPPITIAARDGWQVITERPEHWRCNFLKGTRLDTELAPVMELLHG
jgi:hypothetical protein